MTIITLMGSPRLNGNTATVLNWVEDELRSNGAEVERINIIELNILGCSECFHCRQLQGELGCSLNDDALQVFRRMHDAGAVVYASPLFSWGFSAQMKSFIDRHFCLVTGQRPEDMVSYLAGKPISLLVTAAGPIEANADLILETFRRLAQGIQCTVCTTLVIPYCTTPDLLEEHVRTSAALFARRLLTYRE